MNKTKQFIHFQGGLMSKIWAVSAVQKGWKALLNLGKSQNKAIVAMKNWGWSLPFFLCAAILLVAGIKIIQAVGLKTLLIVCLALIGLQIVWSLACLCVIWGLNMRSYSAWQMNKQ
jgi:hypothetical protein